MQNCKSIVTVVFECYFFITSSCIREYGLHYVRYDVSITRNKGLMKELYFIILSRRKFSFHAKFPVHCSPVLTQVWLALSGLKEVKGLTEKLYAYAPTFLKTRLRTKCSLVLWLVSFEKKQQKMNLRMKTIFCTSCDILIQFLHALTF